MLDIGGNIGWYPSLLGRYGYTILTFEAYPNNYYRNMKINNEDKICGFYM